MNKKQILRVSVDIAMTVLLILLMSYSLVGEAAHEWLGVAMFMLFVLHHVLNRSWYRSIFKEGYTPYRITQTIFVIFVFITMCGSMISGVILSRTVFSFLRIRGGQAAARTVHMLCAYWGFVFMSLHLGLHWSVMLHMAGRLYKKKSPVRSWIVRIIGWLIAAYGVYAFWKRSIIGYMLLRYHFVFFDSRESLILYWLDYIAIMSLFVCAGYYLAYVVRKIRTKGIVKIGDRGRGTKYTIK